MTMPKASVDKNCFLSLGEIYVRLSRQMRTMKPITKSKTENQFTNQ